jgi:cytochrome c
VTFGFGNQHSIQLSYGRTQSDSTRSASERPWRARQRATRSQRGFRADLCPRYNARLVLRQRTADFTDAAALDGIYPARNSTMSDEHTSPIKTPKQLAIVLALAFLIPITLFLLLSQLVTGVRRDDTGETEAKVLARIKPVGDVTLASAADVATTTAATAPTTSAPAAPPPGAAAAGPASTGGAAAPSAAAAPATKAGAPLDLQSGQALMQKDGCAACHAVDKAIVGPAYSQVAAKYRGDKTAAAKLEQKVKAGGSGVWGPVPMPPNAAVPDADIKALVSWILSLK